MKLSKMAKTHGSARFWDAPNVANFHNIGLSQTEMRDWGDLVFGDATAVNLPVSNPLKMVELLGEAGFRDGRIVV